MDTYAKIAFNNADTEIHLITMIKLALHTTVRF